MTSSLLVSIVNWNTRDELHRCLTSVQRAAGTLQLRVVVIDNASDDGSADMVRHEFADVTLLEPGRNLGFAGGNNAALAVCDSDYVCVLNPDVEVTPHGFERLIAFLEQQPQAAAVAPLLTGADGSAQTHMYRRFPSVLQVALFWTLLRPLARAIGPLRRRLFEHDLRGDEPVEVDQLPGAALMIRRQAFDRVGTLDAGYFVWWEDVDWCWRVMRAGFTLHVLPAVRFRHSGGASFGRWSTGRRVSQFYRAFYRFLARHGLRRLSRAVTPIIAADLVLKDVLLRLARRRESLQTARHAVRAGADAVERGVLLDFAEDDAVIARPMPQNDLPFRAEMRFAAAPVDVIVVNWNGCRFLPRCLAALRASTIPVRIIVVDNASSDGSADYVRTEHPDLTLLSAGVNLGYAGGANLGLAHGAGDYAVILNPDVIVDPGYVERLRDRLDELPRVGAAQGKLYGVTPEQFERGECARTRIDSAGHVIRRSRMVVDRGQGHADVPAYDAEAEIFSACGAALFLRRSMLDDVAPDGRAFDDAFFAYKEDIDLGWRARLLGWQVLYVPDAVAFHVRALPHDDASWRSMSTVARRHSWKNHYLLMIRNDRVGDLLRHLPFVLAWELGRLAHALLRDRDVLPAYRTLWRQLPQALRARRALQRRRRTEAVELRSWFGSDARAGVAAPAVRPGVPA